MAEDELELNALGENDSELFDEVKDIVEGEGGEDHDDLEEFLVENKLSEHLSLFRDQQIDFETLMILTEPDLKSLGLPLGPFRKLIVALKKKKSDSDGLDDGKEKKDDSDLPPLADEGNFRVIDESGDDSDAHSVKSEHGGGKKKDDPNVVVEPDKLHPYRNDLMLFTVSEDLKQKIELQEPTTVESKTLEMVSDERRLRNAIKNLRKEKIVAVDSKHVDTYVKTMVLMQISTQTVDYLIDFTKMNHLILMLTDIFTNPNILKVFYDAKYEVKYLQRYYNLFTINAYCVRSAVKELNYETSSLYGLINKYVSYFKPSESEYSQRPIRSDIKMNLRKETHYLLHVYYKTRNEAIEAGTLDNILAVGKRLCGYLHVPLRERKPANIFQDYEKFNDAQKLAAEELISWRESAAKDKNVDPGTILSAKAMKLFCLSLPIKKEELFSLCDTRIVRINFLKLVGIMKTARKKYFNDPKDETKYDLKPVPVVTKPPQNRRSNKPLMSPKPGTNAQGGGGGNVNKPELKRKADSNFVRPAPAKKSRFRTNKKFNQPKRNSFDSGNKAKSPKGSPFRTGGNYRGGYQGNSPNTQKNFSQQNIKYPSPQNVWEPAQNQNFNNSYGAGFKYY